MKKIFSTMLYPLIADEIPGLTPELLDASVAVPSDPSHGDFALPCFAFAKQLRKAPPLIANLLAEKVNADFIDHTETVGGYLNFFVDREAFAQRLTDDINAAEVWGAGAFSGKKARNSLQSCAASVLLCDRTSVGRLSFAIIFAMVKVFPEPVTP